MPLEVGFHASPSPSDSSSGDPASNEFVGRLSEMSTLKSALQDALSGSGRLVMVAGDPGIGKTRTALELAAYAESQDVQVLWGRCYENQGAPPYWPWVQIVRSYARSGNTDTLLADMGAGAADIAALVPDLRELLPDLPSPVAWEDSEQARFRLFNSVSSFLSTASRSKPLMLVLDNLHGADKPSLLLLEFLAEEVAQSRLLVLGTYRDLELSRQHPLFESLAQLSRAPRFRRINLRGLGREDVGRYIQHVAGATPNQSLVKAVHDQTEGNPLFVTEVVRLLAQERALATISSASLDAQATAKTHSRAISIPEGIREVIGRRLNGLSESCVQTLTIASVIGREFGLNELEWLIDHMSEERLIEALEEAVAARIIEEAPQGMDRYQFSHVLIRETLYDDLTGSRRSRLHRRIGEAMEELYGGNLEAYLAQLSYHFFEAARSGDPEKAIDYCQRAAERDMTLLAYEEAARYYQMALQGLELKTPVDEARRCKLLLAQGEAHMAAGESILAREAFQQAADVARELMSPDDLARAALGFEEAGMRPGFPGGPAIELLKDSLDSLEEGDSTIKARVLGHLARAFYFSGAMEQVSAIADEAMRMAQRIGDPATLAEVLNVTLYSLRMPDTLETRLQQADEAIRLATELDDIQMLLFIRAWLLFDLLEAGNLSLEEFNRELDDYEEHAERFHQPFFLYVIKSVRTIQSIAEGRLKEAERLAQEALSMGQRLRGADATGVFGMHMFTLRRAQGRLQEIAPAVRLFIQEYSENAAWRPGLALIYSELGMETDARAEFERLAADNFASIPQDAVWVACMVYLSEVCTYLGDSRHAATLYRYLSRYDRHNIVIGGGVAHYGSASRYLGQLATVMSRWDEAERHFDNAIEMEVHNGSRTWLAHTRYEFARMLLKRGLPGDAERAVSLLREAQSATGKLGMRSLDERVIELQRQAEARVGERLLAHPYPDDLTEREVEVLRLIAGGKSNREIAGELFITTNTVANHVKNILSKTDSANRTEAAAYAMRHNLT